MQILCALSLRIYNSIDFLSSFLYDFILSILFPPPPPPPPHSKNDPCQAFSAWAGTRARPVPGARVRFTDYIYYYEYTFD